MRRLHDEHHGTNACNDADSCPPLRTGVRGIIDNHGYVLEPVPVAPVNETDMVLLPEGLKALKEVACLLYTSDAADE